ncbi:hypothetical protein ACFV24_16200 [Nocardia fluminea]|uniref:hypothetical protein n=1 Tax=Nocardia fluminea TaxID=134984 RepID=UPI00367209F3
MLEAGQLFGCVYDILRFHAESDADLLADDDWGRGPLELAQGKLGQRLRELLRRENARGAADVSALDEFCRAFEAATELRNDLAHGLPTRQGLFRAKRKRLYDTAESFREITRQFRRAGALANSLICSDPVAHGEWVAKVTEGRVPYTRQAGTSAPNL